MKPHDAETKSVIGNSPEEFAANVKSERERIRELFHRDRWKQMDSHELIGCPLCGAAVNDPVVHADWHVRILQ